MRSRSSIAVWRSPTRLSRNAVALAFAALAFAGAAHAQDAALAVCETTGMLVAPSATAAEVVNCWLVPAL